MIKLKNKKKYIMYVCKKNMRHICEKGNNKIISIMYLILIKINSGY